MAERGSGAIINLGWRIIRLGIPASPLYSSAKDAIETLTRAWPAEFGPAGMHLNAISPRRHPRPARRNHQRLPLGRGDDARHPVGDADTPGAIAHAAAHPASDEAAFVHGTVIDVDGGRANIDVMAH